VRKHRLHSSTRRGDEEVRPALDEMKGWNEDIVIPKNDTILSSHDLGVPWIQYYMRNLNKPKISPDLTLAGRTTVESHISDRPQVQKRQASLPD
jgi:hypothetical protein